MLELDPAVAQLHVCPSPVVPAGVVVTPVILSTIRGCIWASVSWLQVIAVAAVAPVGLEAVAAEPAAGPAAVAAPEAAAGVDELELAAFELPEHAVASRQPAAVPSEMVASLIGLIETPCGGGCLVVA
jgi:hypothetical protein